MSIYLPLIFFSVILFIVYMKRGVDISTYTIALYVITSFFAVVIFNTGNSPYSTPPSIISSIVYCGLIGICLLPVYKFDSKKIVDFHIDNIKIINYVTYFYFFSFIVYLLLYWQDILFVLSFGDWEALRNMISDGDSIAENRYSGIFGILMKIIGIFNTVSFIMIPIFFVYITCVENSRKFAVMALLSSLSVLLIGILNCDRSTTFRFILLLGFNLVFFWPLLNKQKKKRIVPVVFTVLGLCIVYMASVTKGRFEDSRMGVENSVINYAGQPYIHFAYMYDNMDNKEGFNTHYMFPAIHTWIIGDYKGNTTRQKEVSASSGIECGVFYTFLGSFLIDANQPGPYVFVFVYLLLANILSRRRKSSEVITFNEFIENYFLFIIVVFGIISYPYTSPGHTVAIILLLLLFNKVRIA